MSSRTTTVLCLAAAVATMTMLVSCGSDRETSDPPASALGNDTLTIASFDFAESEVLELCGAGTDCPGGDG